MNRSKRKTKVRVTGNPTRVLVFRELAKTQSLNLKRNAAELTALKAGEPVESEGQRREQGLSGEDRKERIECLESWFPAAQWTLDSLRKTTAQEWARDWLRIRFGVVFPTLEELPVDCWIDPALPDVPRTEGSATLGQAVDLYYQAEGLCRLAFGGDGEPALAKGLEELAAKASALQPGMSSLDLGGLSGSLVAAAVASRACVHHATLQGILPKTKKAAEDLPARVFMHWLRAAGMKGHEIGVTMVLYGFTPYVRPEQGSSTEKVPKALRDRVNQKSNLKASVALALRDWAQRTRAIHAVVGTGPLPGLPDMRTIQFRSGSDGPLPRWVLSPIPELWGLLFVWLAELEAVGWKHAEVFRAELEGWLEVGAQEAVAVTNEWLGRKTAWMSAQPREPWQVEDSAEHWFDLGHWSKPRQ